jgi:nitroreductase
MSSDDALMRTSASEELCFGTDAGLWDVMSTMRAMRKLKPDPVPRDLLEQLVEAASWAPNASNGQAYSWVIVTDRQILKELDPLWTKCFEFYHATLAPGPGDTMDDARLAGLRRAVTHQRDHFTEIPALLIACYTRVAPPKRLLHEWRSFLKALAALSLRDAVAITIGARRSTAMVEAASVYPAVQNLLLTARALGLGATLTNWHLMFEEELKRTLGIPPTVATFAVIPVGWPLGRFGPVHRKPAAEVTHWDRW